MSDRRSKKDRRRRSTPVLRVRPDGVERAQIAHRPDNRRSSDRRKQSRD